MESILEQLSFLIITPPGELFYHLILIITPLICLQAQLGLRAHMPKEHVRRIVLGMSLLLISQISFFLLNSFLWRGLENPRLLLPPLDRSVAAAAFIWIIWMWGFKKPGRLSDLLMAILILIVAALLTFSIIAWKAQAPVTAYNSTLWDWIWSAFSLAILIPGLFLLIFRRPRAWGLTFFLLCILTAGTIAHMLWADPSSDFTPYVRLAQLCSFPLLTGLVYYHLEVPDAIKRLSKSEKQRQSRIEAPFWWLDAFKEEKISFFLDKLLRAVTFDTGVMGALWTDLSTVSDTVTITHGYLAMNTSTIHGITWKKGDIIAIEKSLGRNILTRLDRNPFTETEFKDFGHTLSIDAPIDQLVIDPICSSEKYLSSLMLITSTTTPEWEKHTDDYLNRLKPYILQSLKRFQNQAVIIKQKADAESLPVVASLPLEQDDVQRYPEEDKQPQLELPHETKAIPEMSIDKSQHMHRTLSILNEASPAVLDNYLSIYGHHPAEEKVKEAPTPIVNEAHETVKQFSDALNDYVDLLGNPSVQQSDALHQRILNQAKSQAEHILQALDHKDSEMDYRKKTLRNRSVLMVIDRVVDNLSGKYLDKNINLQLDLPEECPNYFHKDEFLEQIIVGLLQHAGEVTPPEGTVRMEVNCQSIQDGQRCLIIRIADDGSPIQASGNKFPEQTSLAWVNVLVSALGGTISAIPMGKSGNIIEVLIPNTYHPKL